MEDALEVRVAHADFPHVVDGVADIVDAKAPLAGALRHQPRASVQVQFADVGGVRGVGEEGERKYPVTGAQLRAEQPRRIHPARHFALPEPRKGMPHAGCIDAERHAPARAAAAQTHDEPRLALRPAVACGKDT